MAECRRDARTKADLLVVAAWTDIPSCPTALVYSRMRMFSLKRCLHDYDPTAYHPLLISLLRSRWCLRVHPVGLVSKRQRRCVVFDLVCLCLLVNREKMLQVCRISKVEKLLSSCLKFAWFHCLLSLEGVNSWRIVLGGNIWVYTNEISLRDWG